MSQKYEVVLLSPKQWDKTVASDPRYVNAVDSFGFADVKKNKAYVRNMYWPELNRYLINHEFEHLVEEHATDEDEHGIRHKGGFFKTIAPILGGLLGSFLLPGLGTAIGGGLGGALSGGVGSALGAGLGSFGGAKVAGQSTGSALLTGGLGAAGSGINSLLGNPVGSLLGGAGKAVSGALGPVGSSLGGVASGAAGSIGNVLNNFTGGTAGNLLSGAGNVLGGAANAVGGAAKSLGSGISNLFSPSAGSNNVAPKLSVGGLGGRGGSTMYNFNLNPFGSGGNPPGAFGTSQAFPLLSSAGAVGAGGSAAAPVGSGGNPPGAFGTSQAFPLLSSAGAVGAGGSAAAPAANAGGGGIMSLFDGGLLKGAAGLGVGVGLPLLANKMFPNPQVPDLTKLPGVQDFTNMIKNPSAGGQAAQALLQQRLSTPYGITSDQMDNLKYTFAQERKNTSEQFKQFRPNADLATDSEYRKAMNDIDQRQAAAIDEATRANRAQQDSEIGQQLGLDQATLSNYQQIAQLSVDQIMAQLGLDASKAQQFKQVFGQIGGSVAAAGMGLNSFQIPKAA